MMSDQELEQLIAAWLDGRIKPAESESLQQRLLESSSARTTFRALTNLDASLRVMATVGVVSNDSKDRILSPSQKPPGLFALKRWKTGLAIWAQLAIAAAVLTMVGWFAFQLGKSETPATLVVGNTPATPGEKTISGHASLRRVAGIQWSDESNSYREGDVLPAGIFRFDSGVAEIDFFCGATVVVEGPAEMDLESDWSVRLLAGRLRANVPPAARGFVVKAADAEIVDLGTEFALEVGSNNVRVEVVEGEVELRGGAHDGQHLLTGEAQTLVGDTVGSLKNLSTLGDVRRLDEDQKRLRFEKWQMHSRKFRADNRLLAYFPIAESRDERSVPNQSLRGSELDGKIIGLVDQADGRFGAMSSSLGFGRPGSRVRTRIDGEFDAFTFAGWVKIDNLEHQYNALFMGDGYENGEPHWQIRDDGRLMFSVMVDDTPGSGEGKAPDARLNWVYFSDPVWNATMSGKWMHVAAVYDPAARRVTQYVNGEPVSTETITSKYFVDKLRIGPAEIGNWGQPFRKSPEFAVRNLNGAIDELAIFGSALKSDEIKALYVEGKPFGY